MRDKKIYFENFDALRFIAAFAVLAYHTVSWLKPPDSSAGKVLRILLSFDGSGGDAGVNFFFALSGFLISYLMFAELNTTGKVNLIFFYIRRVLRIWPLYYLSLVIGFVVYPNLVSAFHEKASPLLYSFFLANFDNMYGGWPQTGILGVQWSVSVEEQFYLVWPLLFLIFSRGRFYPLFCCLLIAVSNWYVFSGGLHYHPLSCMRELSLGALAAWIAFSNPLFLERSFNKLSKSATLVIYVVSLLSILLNYQIQKNVPWLSPWCLFFQSIFFVFVILEQTYSRNSFIKFGSIQLFTRWGKVSYGIYLLHMVAIYLIIFLEKTVHVSIWLQIPGAMILTILLSELSYRFFESYFLRLKSNFTKILTRS